MPAEGAVPATSTLPERVDVLVVGTGPVGTSYAREILEQAPGATVVLIDAGPQLTRQLGKNIRNLGPDARREVQLAATRWTGQTPSDTGRIDGRIAARPGTFLLNEVAESEDEQEGMPAAAMAANIGGMGAHWTCACPPPGDSERIAFLEDRFDEAFGRAWELLSVTQAAFPANEAQRELQEKLSAIFDQGRSEDRRVQPMPLACTPTGEPLPRWSGIDTILSGLDESARARLTIVPNVVCTKLVHDSGTVTAVQLVERESGTTHLVEVSAVAIAADALRTPQLLWASGIRPPALGRYLNDQPQIVSALAVREDASHEAHGGDDTDFRQRLTGVLWIPFHDPDFPFHTQVMQIGTSPIELPDAEVEHRRIITWGRFTTKDIREEDRIEFSDTESDVFGLPKMTIHYSLSEKDWQTIERAKRDMVDQAATIGDFFSGSQPRLLPAGSSMHYQGSVRMGEYDDGLSVCDPNSRVWGTSNVYVGGNGVIPTATACNPTPTSVALAVLGARDLVTRL
ncbi:hypothetical protein MRBLMI12_004403 [Microbacterium sp. LMI12-1-1.1]|uniref:GMC oxidoreductase n=1 Tax=Microbacterium sp. LMI12-1-1.1 TaxID=3135225 RepID=UPI00342ACA97